MSVVAVAIFLAFGLLTGVQVRLLVIHKTAVADTG